MRKATELGWTTAYVFAGQRPAVTYMDDILFDKPIELGSVLYFKAQVAYTEGPFVQVSHDSIRQFRILQICSIHSLYTKLITKYLVLGISTGST